MTSDHTRNTRPLDLYPFIPDLISSDEDKNENKSLRSFAVVDHSFSTRSAIGAGCGATTTHSAEELAKQSQNPIANLVSVPLQNNFYFGADRSTGRSTQALSSR